MGNLANFASDSENWWRKMCINKHRRIMNHQVQNNWQDLTDEEVQDTKHGLTDTQVLESRQRHGDNVLTPPKRTSMWKLYMEKYRDPIIRILLVAAAVSLVLAFIENDFVETFGILLAIVTATTVGFYFERDAASKFRLLTAINEDQPVKVRRNGRVVEIPRRDVVVGDVILVGVGDEIPADAELLECVNLQVDESSLTGEPLTTKAVFSSSFQGQNGEQQNEGAHGGATYPAHLILRSTMVMNGHGEAVVTRVGDKTEIGRVAASATENTHTKTPLSMQLAKLAKLISIFGTTVAVIAFVCFLVRDILTNPIWHGTDYFAMALVVLNYFMMAVTLIVMAVPEGLPMAVTLALALNMRRMLKSNNLVRKLHASETMGAVTVICTDKTGTLTENKMQVGSLTPISDCNPEKDYPSLNSDSLESDRIQEWLAIAIAVNTTAELDGDTPIGNPTEGALLLWLKENGYDYLKLRHKYPVQEQIAFSTEKKYMATTVSIDGRPWTFLKGAPETVLGACGLTTEARQDIDRTLSGYQRQAMRTLALAFREGTFAEPSSHADYHGQAVVAISDPVRADVPAAIAQCHRAGIKVKVVTGDTSETAIEIARQIGCLESKGKENGKGRERWHITGAEFAALSDEEAYDCVEQLCVMSRARPADKQRLVQLLQKHGEVVAVTGDGTNDAPALNYAHVGLSLGSGTSVAKRASDITLLDDSFHSIASAVMWGRSLYKNIQRFLYFQLVVNLSALLLVLGGSFIGTEMPLTVTQILWVNLIMDSFAAMALASLAPSREVMLDKPRSQREFIISRPIGRGILSCGILFFAVMFVFLIWCERHGAGSIIDVHELTLFFTTFVMLQFWNLLNAKCLGSCHSALRHILRERGLLFVLLLILAGQWLIVTFGGRMFRTQPLSFGEWAGIVGLTGLFVFGGGELWHAVCRLVHRHRA